MKKRKSNRHWRKRVPEDKKTMTVSITLRKDIVEWLDKVCSINNRTRSNFINHILEDKRDLGTEIELSGGLGKVSIPEGMNAEEEDDGEEND